MRQLVVAHDSTGVTGQEGHIPWLGQLPADMKHFRTLTTGNAVVMGRTTFDSLTGPLPNRLNVVLSRQTDLHIDGCTVVHDINSAFKVAEEYEHTFIIGGQSVYELAMPHVERLEVTVVEAMFEGDTYFVKIDPARWQLAHQEQHVADERNLYNYRFERYDRIVR